jgi:hypothetical protein
MVTVEQTRFRHAILSAIADTEMIMILDCATFRSKSVSDIIRETRIPHSTAYRKIKWMLEEGLLFTEKIDITPDGKKFSLFKSTIRWINVRYEFGKITAEVEYNINMLERTAQRLFSLGID